MWWDIATAIREEFEHWHSHEHFPERMSIEGFRRGSRFRSASGGDGFFVIYELDDYETLTSAQYLARLNAPTPWSTKMMPQHRNMVRSQCRVVASFGGGIAQSLLTLRLPRQDAEEALRAKLSSALSRLPLLPGITAAHLLRTDTPPVRATREQLIRGGDKHADWIALVSGYDARVVADTVNTQLGGQRLASPGSQADVVSDLFALSYTVTPADMS